MADARAIPTRLDRAALLLALLIALMALLAPRPAHATPFWTAADFEKARLDAGLPGGRVTPSGPLGKIPEEGFVQSHIDFLGRFGDAAAFVATLQVADTSNPNYGGIIEGEHLPTIIQTDNTSESIWLWTRYFELTGDSSYFPNIRASFDYSLAFPAHDEEGGSFPFSGYYRMYNCGWACFAEWTYRTVTSDTTYKFYGDSCASYIATHNLNRNGAAFDQYVSPPVLSWAAGNLWRVGNAQGNQAWRDAAASRGLKVKGWIEGEPTLLSNETWAVTGGASMWGVLNSWFAEHPESLAIWTDAFKDSMDDYALPLGAFTNAWNGWYSLGHYGVWQAIRYDAARVASLALADTIAAEDGDLDGGIKARPADADTMDQTWVTSYLAFMGLDPWIRLTAVPGPTPGVDPEAGEDAGSETRPAARVATAPNPFRDGTSVRLSLPRPGRATLDVFDVEGRLVRRLADGMLAASETAVPWDGRDASGRRSPPGVYILRLVTPEGASAAKTVRLR